MNLNLQRVPNKEVINSQFLSKIYRQQNKKEGLSYKGPLSNNRISYPIMSVEDFERRFQFNNVVRTYNNLIGNKKKISNSIESKENSKGSYLPIIKEIKIKKNNKNDYEYNDSAYNQESSENKNKMIKSVRNNYNSSENNELDLYNSNNDFNERNRKSKYYGTNSTLSQSMVFNKSHINSNMSLDNIEEKKKLLMRNLSHESIFEAYKARYALATKDFKNKSKLAESDYRRQLEIIKKEKMPKSKNEEFFKEYELKFSADRMKEKLKDEFHFFHQEIQKKAINETDLRLERLFKKLKKNEEKKSIWSYFDIKRNNIKPSQRSILNMLRKDKKVEIIENSLLDLPEEQ